MNTGNKFVYFLLHDNNKITIAQREITPTNIDKFNSMMNYIEASYQYPADRIKYVNNNGIFKKLLGQYNYCNNLSSTYQGHFKTLEETIDKYLILNNSKELINFKNEQLKRELLQRKEALDYMNTLNAPETQNLKNKSIAHSHYLVGWKTFTYRLNSVFEFEIITNFGYGNVSYFYSKLIYKNLQIVPFSDWILYKDANFHEIIRYSKKFKVEESSWLNAFEYIVMASESINRNELNFIKEYIIDQCYAMINGLNDILNNNEFKFIVNERLHTANSMTSHEIIELRGEKISGALDFINEISKFSELIDTNKFVNDIENINRTIKPILIEEIDLLQEKIIELEAEKQNIGNILTKFKFVYEKLVKEKCDFVENEVKKDPKQSLNDINLRFIKIKPKYLQVEDEYKNLENSLNQCALKINSLKVTQSKIQKHLIKINEYFRGKLTKLGVPLSI